MTNMKDIEDMTLVEYYLRIDAMHIRDLKDEHAMYKSAYLHHVVTATKEKGKTVIPVYKTFKDFYDYEARYKALLDIDNKDEETVKKTNVQTLVLQANSQQLV